METIQIKDNFLKKKTIKTESNESLISELGFFPNAKYHYIKRQKGAPEYILILCLNGEGYIEIDNNTTKLSAKSFIILDKNKKHTYYTNNDNPWSIYWCHFKELNNDLVGKIISISSLRFNSVISVFENILNLRIDIDKNLEYINLSWHYILETLFIDEGYHKKHTNSIIEKLETYMKENISSNMSLNDFAYYVNLSTSQLNKLFKKYLNTTPMKYYTSLKIDYAINLLINTNLSMSEIANAIGIDDVFYFSRLFKKTTGKSPLNYKKNI